MNRFIFNTLPFIIVVVLLAGCTKKPKEAISLPKETSVALKEEIPKIEIFLKTHFYNYEDFQNPPEGFDYFPKIDTISGENTNKRSLMDDPNIKEYKVTIDNVEHTIHCIVIREGKGGNPTFADSVLVRYEGYKIPKLSSFGKINIPFWFDLPSNIRGWSNGVPLLKTSSSKPIINADGTSTFQDDYGIGILIFPSKLGYFNITKSGIPSYSPLVFTVHLLSKKETDHDQDGIKSKDEDLNGNQYLLDDNTDLEFEPLNRIIPNYLDYDDDGDGTPTKEEYDVRPKDGKADDTDKDGIPDYLDNT